MSGTEMIFTGDMTELHGKNFYYSKRRAMGEFNVIKPHMHTHYELYYLTDGSRRYFVKNRIFTVQEGDFILIRPNTVHYTANVGKNGHERILLNFTGDYIDPRIKDAVERLFELNCISVCDSRKNCIMQLFEEIAEEYAIDDAYSEVRRAALLNELFISLLRSRKIQPSATGERSIDAVLDFVETHLAEEITVDTAARVAGLSRSHFSRIFPKLTGFTFADYLKLQRLECARQLLEKTDESITAVAFSCGFAGSSYFATVFRNCFGVSPLEYRKRFSRQ